MNKFETLCPDFEEWPSKWMGLNDDLIYGKKLLEEIRPFVEQLVYSELTDKTIKKHLENLWLLGGEIIRTVSDEQEYNLPPLIILSESVDSYGGPPCRHLHSEAEENSFNSTCKKLHKHLKNKIG